MSEIDTVISVKKMRLGYKVVTTINGHEAYGTKYFLFSSSAVMHAMKLFTQDIARGGVTSTEYRIDDNR